MYLRPFYIYEVQFGPVKADISHLAGQFMELLHVHGDLHYRMFSV